MEKRRKSQSKPRPIFVVGILVASTPLALGVYTRRTSRAEKSPLSKGAARAPLDEARPHGRLHVTKACQASTRSCAMRDLMQSTRTPPANSIPIIEPRRGSKRSQGRRLMSTLREASIPPRTRRPPSRRATWARLQVRRAAGRHQVLPDRTDGLEFWSRTRSGDSRQGRRHPPQIGVLTGDDEIKPRTTTRPRMASSPCRGSSRRTSLLHVLDVD